MIEDEDIEGSNNPSEQPTMTLRKRVYRKKTIKKQIESWTLPTRRKRGRRPTRQQSDTSEDDEEKKTKVNIKSKRILKKRGSK